jgi:hypothetical protein
MSDADENPFQSPPPARHVRLRPLPRRPTHEREIAGIGVFSVAALAAFVCVMSIVRFDYRGSNIRSAAHNRIMLQGMVVGGFFAALLTWAGHRLQTRSHGKPEWVIVLLFFLFVVVGVASEFLW